MKDNVHITQWHVRATIVAMEMLTMQSVYTVE